MHENSTKADRWSQHNAQDNARGTGARTDGSSLNLHSSPFGVVVVCVIESRRRRGDTTRDIATLLAPPNWQLPTRALPTDHVACTYARTSNNAHDHLQVYFTDQTTSLVHRRVRVSVLGDLVRIDIIWVKFGDQRQVEVRVHGMKMFPFRLRMHFTTREQPIVANKQMRI